MLLYVIWCVLGGGVVVEIDQGDVLVDIVVVGIGVVLNVELVQVVGFDVDNGICVDVGCCMVDVVIFVVGEVMMYFNLLFGWYVWIELWQVVENQLVVVVVNLFGVDEIYVELLWLWLD